MKAQIRMFLVATIFGLLPYSNAYAFTSQILIEGFEFFTPLNVVNSEVGAITGLYTVPEDRIAVITDIYITLSSSATGNHTTFITNGFLQTRAGPFHTAPENAFNVNYTSGIVFIEGEQIIAGDTGGSGDVTVNLVGYLVCRGSCE